MATILVQPVDDFFSKKDLNVTTVVVAPETPPASPPRKLSLKPFNSSESRFMPKCHAREPETTKAVDEYFLKHWPFKNDKERKTFVDAGFSRVTCFYFPEAINDRIHHACRLLTILFLIDDLLEDMSFDEGSAYNEYLIPIARGDVLPNRLVPAEYLMYDIWQDMRVCDIDLANEILEPVFVFMRAQTDRTRVGITELGSYLHYRERDVGKALLAALMRFTMGLRLTPEELESVKDVDENCAKHISVINDIYSWEKEVIASKQGHEEGSALCSSVQVLSDVAKLSVEGSKRVLFSMCREWEVCHHELKALRDRNTTRDEIFRYIKGLEYQMSGNEEWSRTTLRYIGVH